jgi:hypothetical protein
MDAGSYSVDNYIGTDIDAWRDRFPVRHKVVQRVNINGGQVGQLKVERLVGRRSALREPASNPSLIPETRVNGWYRIHYSTTEEISLDLQLMSAPEGAVYVAAVAAGGIAHSAGVCIGSKVTALNGNSDDLRGQLGHLLMGQATGAFTLDLVSPTASWNAKPSYGDVWARAPFSTPGFIDSGI